jgi:hypothetical protein
VKKILTLSLMICTLAFPVWAEDPPKPKTIFDYKQEIGLSDAQITSMQQYLANLNTNVKASKAKITQLENDFRALIAKEASSEEAKAKLQEIASATVTMRLNDFETSKKINETMTPEQKKKWRAIQAKLRGNQ